MVISDYYSSLKTKEKTTFIQKVIERCDISYPAFMYKMRKDSWTKLEREAIELLIKLEQDERAS